MRFLIVTQKYQKSQKLVGVGGEWDWGSLTGVIKQNLQKSNNFLCHAEGWFLGHAEMQKEQKF